jgi:hypothetical protein
MKDISKVIRRTQELENSAADKAGVRFLLFQEEKLLGKDRDAYIQAYVDMLLADIAPEVIEAAQLGRGFLKVVRG